MHNHVTRMAAHRVRGTRWKVGCLCTAPPSVHPPFCDSEWQWGGPTRGIADVDGALHLTSSVAGWLLVRSRDSR